MKKLLTLFLLGSIILFQSCEVYKSPTFSKINSVSDLSGTYVDPHGKIAACFDYDKDKVDIFKINFTDDHKKMEFSCLTDTGMHLIRTFKGKYNKKKNFFETTINSTTHFFIIYNNIMRDKLKIGFDDTQDLILERNMERTASVLFVMFTEYMRGYTDVKNSSYSKLDHRPILIDGKWGYSNEKDEVFIVPKYDFARIFEKGANVARVRSDGKWGMVNWEGKEVVPTMYDKIERFDSLAYARIQLDDKVGLVGQLGQEVVAPIYDEIMHLGRTDSRSFSKLGNKYGFLWGEGVLYDPVFDKIEHVVSESPDFEVIKKLIPYYIFEVKIDNQSFFADDEGYLYKKIKGNYKNPQIDLESKIYYKDIQKNKDY